LTAQIPDRVIFRDEEYELIGLAGGELFNPVQFGMEPAMISTACYRGFYATYELTGDVLYLQQVTLREKHGKYPPIQGIEAECDPFRGEILQGTYHSLDFPMPFSGKLRLAKDFIEELYVHMGFQDATAFRTVYDLTLEAGKLVEVEDRSEEVEKIRGAFKEEYMNDPFANIDKAFSLDLDLE